MEIRRIGLEWWRRGAGWLVCHSSQEDWWRGYAGIDLNWHVQGLNGELGLGDRYQYVDYFFIGIEKMGRTKTSSDVPYDKPTLICNL